ncbi:MAG: class I SAM-dependent methyltransferase [Pseudomonadota bacterium]
MKAIFVRDGDDIHIDRALKIEGWMTQEELLWLAEQAKTHNSIAEIGSYMGRSTRVLGDNTSGVVYAYDDWYGPREVAIPDSERDLLWQKFCDNLKDLIGKKVIPCRKNHTEFSAEPLVDMVFIDGDHQYDSVKRDIDFWRNRLANGGLLCGHDLDQEQVKKAVTDCLGYVTNPAGYIWAVCL